MVDGIFESNRLSEEELEELLEDLPNILHELEKMAAQISEMPPLLEKSTCSI